MKKKNKFRFKEYVSYVGDNMWDSFIKECNRDLNLINYHMYA